MSQSHASNTFPHPSPSETTPSSGRHGGYRDRDPLSSPPPRTPFTDTFRSPMSVLNTPLPPLPPSDGSYSPMSSPLRMGDHFDRTPGRARSSISGQNHDRYDFSRDRRGLGSSHRRSQYALSPSRTDVGVPSASRLNISAASAASASARPMTAPAGQRAHSRTRGKFPPQPTSPFSASASAPSRERERYPPPPETPVPPHRSSLGAAPHTHSSSRSVGGGLDAVGGGLDATLPNFEPAAENAGAAADPIDVEIRDKQRDIHLLRKRQLDEAFKKNTRLSQQLDEAYQKITQLGDELRDERCRYANMQSNFEYNIKLLEERDEELERFDRMFGENTYLQKENEAEIERLKLQISKLNDLVDRTEAERKTLAGEKMRLANDRVTLEHECARRTREQTEAVRSELEIAHARELADAKQAHDAAESSLRQKVRALEDDLDKRRKELDAQTELTAQREKEVREAERVASRERAEIARQQKFVDKLTNDINRYREETKSLARQLADAEASGTAAAAQLAETGEKWKEESARFNQLVKDLESGNKSKLADYAKKFRHLAEQHRLAQAQQHDSYKAKLAKVQQKHAAILEETVEEEKVRARAELDAKNRDIDRLTAEVTHRDSLLAQARTDADKQRDADRKRKDECERLKGDIAKLEARVEALKCDLKKARNDLHDERSRKAQAEDERDGARDELSEVKLHVRKLENMKRLQQQNIEQLTQGKEGEASAHTAEVLRLNSVIDQLQKDLEDRRCEVERLNLRIQEEASRPQASPQQAKKIESLRSEVARLKRRSASLEEELTDARQSSDEHKRQLDTLYSDFGRSSHRSLSELVEEKRKLERKISLLTEENQQLKRQMRAPASGPHQPASASSGSGGDLFNESLKPSRLDTISTPGGDILRNAKSRFGAFGLRDDILGLNTPSSAPNGNGIDTVNFRPLAAAFSSLDDRNPLAAADVSLGLSSTFLSTPRADVQQADAPHSKSDSRRSALAPKSDSRRSALASKRRGSVDEEAKTDEYGKNAEHSPFSSSRYTSATSFSEKRRDRSDNSTAASRARASSSGVAEPKRPSAARPLDFGSDSFAQRGDPPPVTSLSRLRNDLDGRRKRSDLSNGSERSTRSERRSSTFESRQREKQADKDSTSEESLGHASHARTAASSPLQASASGDSPLTADTGIGESSRGPTHALQERLRNFRAARQGPRGATSRQPNARGGAGGASPRRSRLTGAYSPRNDLSAPPSPVHVSVTSPSRTVPSGPPSYAPSQSDAPSASVDALRPPAYMSSSSRSASVHRLSHERVLSHDLRHAREAAAGGGNPSRLRDADSGASRGISGSGDSGTRRGISGAGDSYLDYSSKSKSSRPRARPYLASRHHPSSSYEARSPTSCPPPKKPSYVPPVDSESESGKNFGGSGDTDSLFGDLMKLGPLDDSTSSHATAIDTSLSRQDRDGGRGGGGAPSASSHRRPYTAASNGSRSIAGAAPASNGSRSREHRSLLSERDTLASRLRRNDRLPEPRERERSPRWTATPAAAEAVASASARGDDSSRHRERERESGRRRLDRDKKDQFSFHSSSPKESYLDGIDLEDIRIPSLSPPHSRNR